MQRVVERSLLWAACAVLLVGAGCKESSCPTATDAGTDGGARVCVVPPATCNAGEHAEFGVCFTDEEEIEIAGGTFQMGAPSGTDFVPQHDVTLSAFKLDKYEVTNGRFKLCVDTGCCDPPRYDGSYTGREPYFGNDSFGFFPVVFVSWDQARQYCEGAGKRLPTEAEWEYAARGDDGRLYPWGSDTPDHSRANFGGARDGDTLQVGSFPSGDSAFGVADMAGNVWEWVADWYDPNYYGSSPANDPPGPEAGNAKVARGGSFGSDATTLYSFYRGVYLPEESFANLGFRCAR
jgi:formylglycine-generating enzyme required for sulfatase activity